MAQIWEGNVMVYPKPSSYAELVDNRDIYRVEFMPNSADSVDIGFILNGVSMVSGGLSKEVIIDHIGHEEFNKHLVR